MGVNEIEDKFRSNQTLGEYGLPSRTRDLTGPTPHLVRAVNREELPRFLFLNLVPTDFPTPTGPLVLLYVTKLPLESKNYILSKLERKKDYEPRIVTYPLLYYLFLPGTLIPFLFIGVESSFPIVTGVPPSREGYLVLRFSPFLHLTEKFHYPVPSLPQEQTTEGKKDISYSVPEHDDHSSGFLSTL